MEEVSSTTQAIGECSCETKMLRQPNAYNSRVDLAALDKIRDEEAQTKLPPFKYYYDHLNYELASRSKMETFEDCNSRRFGFPNNAVPNYKPAFYKQQQLVENYFPAFSHFLHPFKKPPPAGYHPKDYLNFGPPYNSARRTDMVTKDQLAMISQTNYESNIYAKNRGFLFHDKNGRFPELNASLEKEPQLSTNSFTSPTIADIYTACANLPAAETHSVQCSKIDSTRTSDEIKYGVGGLLGLTMVANEHLGPVLVKEKKRSKNNNCLHLWQFLRYMLNEEHNKTNRCIEWTNRDIGEFRLIKTAVIADLWGQSKNRNCMTYEKMARAMRYYYKMKILEKVPHKRLHFRFGEKMLSKVLEGKPPAHNCANFALPRKLPIIESSVIKKEPGLVVVSRGATDPSSLSHSVHVLINSKRDVRVDVEHSSDEDLTGNSSCGTPVSSSVSEEET